MPTQLEPGAMFANYRILSLLGRGGMGEVFLAEDSRLHRKVALKTLPVNLVHDQDRLRRFTHEARAASALNHPNILTIFDIGDADGIPFIATEYIEGQTLRQKLNSGRIPVKEALEIAVQAAGALGAAHDAGIIHRDIKPENIMVRPDGYIKILDFGLAKLTEAASYGPSDTRAMTMTGPGTVMGTAQYMSPEQARGLTLDARSDLFSLGIVIYETLAHRPPFEGETPSHVIVAILEKQPPPVASFAPDTPPQLEPVVDKLLAKDRDERYQTAKDLVVDLRAVRRRMEVEAELRRTTPSAGYPTASVPTATIRAAGTPPPIPPAVPGGATPAVHSAPTVPMQQAAVVTPPPQPAYHTPVPPPPAQGYATPAPPQQPQQPTPQQGYGTPPPQHPYGTPQQGYPSPGPQQAYRTPVPPPPGYAPPPGQYPPGTPSGGYGAAPQDPSHQVHGAGVPPPPNTPPPLAYIGSEAYRDAKRAGRRQGPKQKKYKWVFIVVGIIILSKIFSNHDGRQNDNRGRRAAESRHSHQHDYQLSRVTSSGNSFLGAISPDGRYIAYSETDKGLTSVWLRQTATASNVRVLAPMAGRYRGMMFSPDGNFLYFIRGQENHPDALYRMPTLGGDPTLILSNLVCTVGISPDGKKLAYGRAKNGSGEASVQWSLYRANSDGTEEKVITDFQVGEIPVAFAWALDGDSIAVPVSSFDGGFHTTLYKYDVDDGERHQITKKRWTFAGPLAWMKADGDLVMAASDQLGLNDLQLWHVDTDNGRTSKITNDLNSYTNVTVARDSDKIVAVQQNAVANLYISSAPGFSTFQPVTNGGARADGIAGVSWTPDGRLEFQSRATGMDEIWSANADGTEAKAQTSFNSISDSPSVTPDGKYLVYASAKTGSPEIWRSNPDGSESRRLTGVAGADHPSVSPDSKWIVYHSFDLKRRGLFRVSIDGGDSEKISDTDCTVPEYSRDGKWLMCIVNSALPESERDVAIFPADGGKPDRVVKIPRGVAHLHWAPDSKALTYVSNTGGSSNIFKMPLNGGRTVPLTHISGARIFDYAWNSDGTKLVISKGDIMSDLVLLSQSQE